MASISEKELSARLRLDATGLYLLYGEEAYLSKFYAQQIREKTVDPAFEQFNYHEFEGKNLDYDALYEAVESIAMMSETKCVLVRDLPLDTLNAADTEKLTQIIRDVPPGCALVFLLVDVQVPAKRTAKWKAVLELFEKHGTVTELKRKGVADLRRILAGGIEKRGCKVSPHTLDYFIQSVGSDLNVLLNETDKLCAYAADREITASDIDAVCIKSLEASAFDLTRALLAQQPDKAFYYLDIVMQQEAKALMILGAVNSAFVDLYRVKVAAAARKRPQELGRLFGAYRAKEFRLRNAARDAQNISLARLRRCLEQLHQADLLLKSVGVDERLVLEQTVMALLVLCKPANRR